MSLRIHNATLKVSVFTAYRNWPVGSRLWAIEIKDPDYYNLLDPDFHTISEFSLEPSANMAIIDKMSKVLGVNRLKLDIEAVA